MTLTRRQVVTRGTAGLLMGLTAPRFSFAQTQVGNFTLSSLSDGNLTLPASLVFDPLSDAERALVTETYAFGDTLTPPCNVTLLQADGRNILFDVGSGPEFMSSAGFLFDALDEVGVAPDDITDVIFTHGHPDHLWGVVDDFDDLSGMASLPIDVTDELIPGFLLAESETTGTDPFIRVGGDGALDHGDLDDRPGLESRPPAAAPGEDALELAETGEYEPKRPRAQPAAETPGEPVAAPVSGADAAADESQDA